MVLLPGTYFSGDGVWSFNEPNYVHRLLALMFRVVSDQKIRKSLACMDIFTTQPDEKIENIFSRLLPAKISGTRMGRNAGFPILTVFPGNSQRLKQVEI